MRWRPLLPLLFVVLTAASAAAGESSQTEARLRSALLADINQAREMSALPEVAEQSQLQRAAQLHAEDIAARGVLDHHGRDGSRLGDRLHRVHYDFFVAAENLAEGTVGPAATVSLWLHSPGHRANLLLPEARDIGIGHVQVPDARYPGGERDYWVLVLARLPER